MHLPPYKNANNQWYTSSLFKEKYVDLPAEAKTIPPVFCLYGEHPGLISVQKTFIELEDPTGYDWSMKYLGSYDHFKKLLKAQWFVEAYESYLEEIKVIQKARAIKRISEIASGASAQALAAAKYLATHEWEKAVSGRGRPSKQELRGELAKAVRALTIEEEDAQRVGLTVIQGGKQ